MKPPGDLRFPWPRDGKRAGPAVRLLARDRVWIATLRRRITDWRAQAEVPLPLLHAGTPLQLPVTDLTASDIAVVEAARCELPQLAEAVQLVAPRSLAVVALLCRTSLVRPEDRNAAAELMREAGAAITLATPREAAELDALLTWATSDDRRAVLDPLDELPLPCWNPAWQRPGVSIGLTGK